MGKKRTYVFILTHADIYKRTYTHIYKYACNVHTHTHTHTFIQCVSEKKIYYFVKELCHYLLKCFQILTEYVETTKTLVFNVVIFSCIEILFIGKEKTFNHLRFYFELFLNMRICGIELIKWFIFVWFLCFMAYQPL